MPFQKGQSGNPNGRPKGKTKAELLRERLTGLLEQQFNYFVGELTAQYNGREFVDDYITLLKLVLPRKVEREQPEQDEATESDAKPLNSE